MALKTILINGAEVRDRHVGNRGAEHLLRTTASRLRAMGLQPAVTFNQVDPALVAELGLAQYVGNPRIDKIDSILPGFRTKRFVGIKGLGGVLDASGFALGDAWGTNTAKWVLRKYRQWDNSSLPIIALPQAYGTFNDPALAAMCREALGYAKIIFPRDNVSAEHLHGLGLNHIVQDAVPDITIGESLRRAKARRENRMVIVPNWNLAERGDRGAYFQSLLEATRWAESRGMEVEGVLHEGRKDLALLQQLRTETGLRIIADLTGWETKDYIAASTLVVSGRYHAVIAALTTGTPVLTHSWSHKYLEVLRQFGVEEWLASPDDPDSVGARLAELSQFSEYDALAARQAHMQSKVERMWTQIEAELQGAGTAI